MPTADPAPEKPTAAWNTDDRTLWKSYLRRLLENIATMLEYANNNGIPLPDDLRQKLDELFKSSAVGAYRSLFFK